MIQTAIEKLSQDKCFPSKVRWNLCLNINNDELQILYGHFKLIESFRDSDSFFESFYSMVSFSEVPIAFEKLSIEKGTLFCHKLDNHMLKHLTSGSPDDLLK